jgi:integrase
VASLPAEAASSIVAWTDSVESVVAELDAASDIHAAELRPANTIRSYAADWKAWEAFNAALNAKLEQSGRAPIPAATVSRGLLRTFVSWLWAEKHAAPTTIDRRLAGVAVTLRAQHGVHVEPEDTKAARELLKDYVRAHTEARQAPRGRGNAAPLLLPDLRKISAACPDTLAGRRDRALVLVAFAIAGRRSEVAGLMAHDITEDGDKGLLVSVRVSKTKPREIAVPYGSNPLTCPVRAWQAWRTAADLTNVDAAFQRVDRHGRALGPLSGQAAGEIVTRAAQRAGVHPHLTGHSARAGLATEARRAGKDRTAIAATTGHVPNSAVLDRYIRSVDRWSGEDNALIGIGL